MSKRPSGYYIGGHTIWPSKSSSGLGLTDDARRRKKTKANTRKQIGPAKWYIHALKQRSEYKTALFNYAMECAASDLVGVPRPPEPAILAGLLQKDELKRAVLKVKPRVRHAHRARMRHAARPREGQ